MKKGDIKNAAAINSKKGMEFVSIDRLHETGKSVGFKWSIGDTVTIPDFDDIQIAPDSFVNKANETIEFMKIKVLLNTNVLMIPVAAFRKNANGADELDEEYCSKCTLARSLRSAGDDFDRIVMIAGKTLKVVALYPGRNKKFQQAYCKDDPSTYTTSMWPIFEIIEG